MSSNLLPLFYDEEGKRPVPYRYEGDRVVYEPMAFSHLDGGETALTSFYVMNASMGVIEDFAVKVESVSKDNVIVELVSDDVVDRLAVKDTYHGSLRWTAREGAPAGSCLARISVEGMLTQE